MIDTPQQQPPTLPADVLDALLSGNKIEAIKLLRQRTGIGLKEAKDQIDAVAPQVLKAKIRAHLTPGEQSASGMQTWWWLVVAAAAVAVYYFVR
ncbi:MAG: hypothetical protein RL710_3348 [Pseudomonadota bacterium]|jgi:hypothetical protein|nr:ribosomal protein L7/L12 [Rhodoferax sp.]